MMRAVFVHHVNLDSTLLLISTPSSRLLAVPTGEKACAYIFILSCSDAVEEAFPSDVRQLVTSILFVV